MMFIIYFYDYLRSLFLIKRFFYVTRLAVWCDDKYVVERVEGQRCNCLKVCL